MAAFVQKIALEEKVLQQLRELLPPEPAQTHQRAAPLQQPAPARRQTSQTQAQRSARLAEQVEPLEMELPAALQQPLEVQRRARRSWQPPRPREMKKVSKVLSLGACLGLARS